MRIALAASSFHPHVGGVEEHVRNVAVELRRRGHEIAVWTVSRDGVFAVRECDGIPVWDLPSPLPARSGSALMTFAARAPRAWNRWNRAYRALRPDVIHVHCFGPNGTYALALARAHRIPLIVTSHGETIADDAGVFDHSRLARTSLRTAIRRSTAVSGCSRVVRADLEERFGLAPGSGAIVPNGIDIDEPADPPPPEATQPYIAAVGRLQEVKGFDLLVRAFARADVGPEVTLVIGGDGPESARLRELALENDVADRVILPGRLSRGQVVGLMRDAAAVAVPSRFEAFGIAALEAWRAGTALVATDRGGPPEFVTHGVDGLLCDTTDIDAFAEALTRVLTDASLATTLAENGRRRVASYTWEHTADAYDAFYAGVRLNDGSGA